MFLSSIMCASALNTLEYPASLIMVIRVHTYIFSNHQNYMRLTLKLLKFSKVMRFHIFMTCFRLLYYFGFLSYCNFAQRKAVPEQNIGEKYFKISKSC